MNILLGIVWVILGIVGLIPVSQQNFQAGHLWLVFGAGSMLLYCWWRIFLFCVAEEAMHHHPKMAAESFHSNRMKAFLAIIPLIVVVLGIVDHGMSLFGDLAANISVAVTGLCQLASGVRILRQEMHMLLIRHLK
jgi:uncharacterized membrane protein